MVLTAKRLALSLVTACLVMSPFFHGGAAEPPQAAADAPSRMAELEEEIVALRQLVSKYQTQLANIYLTDPRGREIARLEGAQEAAVQAREEALGELRRLRAEYEEVKQELGVEQNTRQQLQAQVARLENRLATMPERRVQSELTREQLTGELAALTRELKEERARQEADIQRVREENGDLQQQIRVSLAENERLEGRYTEARRALTAAQDGLQLMTAEAEAARQQLKTAEAERERLTAQLAALQAGQAETGGTADLLAALEQSKEAVAQQGQTIGELQATLEDTVANARDESEKWRTRQAETYLALATARVRLQQAMDDAEAARQSLQAAQDEKKKLEETLIRLQGSAEGRADLMAALKESNDARVLRERELAQVRAELTAVSRARERLEQQANQMAAEREQLRADLAEVSQARERLEQQANAKEEQLRAELAAVSQAKERLEGEASAARAESAEWRARQEAASQELAKVRVELTRATTEARTLVKDETATSKALAKVETELQQVKGQAETAKEQLAAAMKQKATLEEEVEQLRARQNEMREARDQLAAVLKETTDARTRQEEALRRLRSEFDRAVASKAGLAADLTQVRQRVEGLEAQNDGTQKALRTARNALRRLTAEKEAADRQLAALSGEKEGMEKRLAGLAREKDEIEKRLTAVAAEKEEIEKRLAAANTEKKAVESRLAEATALQKKESETLAQPFEEAQDRLRDAIEKGEVAVMKAPDRVIIRVGGAALFAPGQVSLRPESLSTLEKVTELLQRFPNFVVRAEGHTDSVPIRSARWPSNWELSSARAAAVVRYLQDQGIPPDRLASMGLSFYRPVASNDTPEGRAANRRIEIALVPKPAGDPSPQPEPQLP